LKSTNSSGERENQATLPRQVQVGL